MKRYIRASEDNSGKYTIVIDSENKYHWLSYYGEIFNKVLGEATCNEPIVLDSFTKDKKDQGDYEREYNYWRKFKGLSLDVEDDTCEVSIPAGTPFILKGSSESKTDIDIFIFSNKSNPVVTMSYKDLAKYSITVSTSAFGDKVGDLMKIANPRTDIELTRLKQFCSLLENVETIFDVNIFHRG